LLITLWLATNIPPKSKEDAFESEEQIS